LLEDNSKVVEKPTTQIKYPIKIYMRDILPFQKQAFEMIKDKFELVEDLNCFTDYEIVSIYGGIIINISGGRIHNDMLDITCPFLRNLFLEKHKFDMIKGKRVFITRKNSECYHNGNLIRYIFNEDILMDMLKKYNFEYIQLEDYSTFDKIKMFAESEVIISSNSGSLTLTLFSNEKSKIIELNKRGLEQYMWICKELNINYYRYSNIEYEDSFKCFYINVEDFEKYLQSII
jgi:capsular polysaccharide biosynthesis protein